MLGSIISGAAQLISGNQAAKAQDRASKRATAEQRRQFDYIKGLATPLYDQGQNANSILNSIYGIGYDGNEAGLAADRAQFNQQFESSPLYQQYFQNALQNANQGIMRNASATGRMNSGNTLMALSDRAGDLAGNSLLQYIAGIGDTSNRGAGAINTLTGAATNYGNSAAQGAYNSGNAKAAGWLGVGNSIANTMGDIYQQRGQQQVMGGNTSGWGF